MKTAIRFTLGLVVLALAFGGFAPSSHANTASASTATGHPAGEVCGEDGRAYIQGTGSPYQCDPRLGVVESTDGLELARCTYSGTLLHVTLDANRDLKVDESSVAEPCPSGSVHYLRVGSLPDPRFQPVDISPSYMPSIQRCTNTGTMLVIFGDLRLNQLGSFEYTTEACPAPPATPHGAAN